MYTIVMHDIWRPAIDQSPACTVPLERVGESESMMLKEQTGKVPRLLNLL